MSSADPLVIFLAGGVTGVLGTVVAEIASSRRQARQLEHELRMGVRETALRGVGEAVDLVAEMLEALLNLRLELKGVAPEDRIGDARMKIQGLLRDCANRLAALRSYELKLILRFGECARNATGGI